MNGEEKRKRKVRTNGKAKTRKMKKEKYNDEN